MNRATIKYATCKICEAVFDSHLETTRVTCSDACDKEKKRQYAREYERNRRAVKKQEKEWGIK